jgi:hypothetical protein
MTGRHQTISLGFTDQTFPAGVHVCQIYSDDDERQESLLRFLLSGLQGGERSACFSERTAADAVRDFLAGYGVDADAMAGSGALVISDARDVYFHDGRFDPSRMLGMLRAFHEQSEAMGFSGARIIGEMPPEVRSTPGGSRLLEYEARVSMLLREHPVTAVCQYDARAFDGAAVMDILKVHPYMIVRSSVVANPFYVAPEEYLRGCEPG